MRIAKKDSWKTVGMLSPKTINISLTLTDQELKKMKFGFVPREMEDKWFIYFDNGCIFFHRSWTGFLIYKAEVLVKDSVATLNSFCVESDASRHTFDSDNSQRANFTSLVEFLVRRPIENPVRASLLGLMVGDALGVPVEFKDREYLRKKPVTDMMGYGTYNQPPGTWSDDSSLTLCLAEALTTDYDLDRIGKLFVRWLYHAHWTPHGHVFDVGISTRDAINRLKEGMRPDLAGGMDVDSNGNGSLMRILPLLFYMQNIQSNVDRYAVVRDTSAITHGHVRSCLACYYYLEFAAFIAHDLKYPLVDAYAVANNALRTLCAELQINPREISTFDRLLNGNLKALTIDEIKSSGYVLHTLEASVWCLLTTSSYEDAVLKAVNLGEDTDTVAAVTGGLAGLYYGEKSIPTRWISQLARIEEIEALIRQLSDKYEIAYM